MPEENVAEKIFGTVKNFFTSNTIGSNIALGVIGFFNMPLMGAFIGANTAWRKSAGASLPKRALAVALGVGAGASVGIVGSLVTGVMTLFAGPVGVAIGVGATALLASYMGKDSATKLSPKPPQPQPQPGQGKAKERARGQGQARIRPGHTPTGPEQTKQHLR